MESESELLSQIELLYSLNQAPLSNCCHTPGCAEQNSRRSRIVVAPLDVLNERVADLEYLSRLIFEYRAHVNNRHAVTV